MPSAPAWLRAPAQHLPLLPHLAVPPGLLAVATAAALFAHSDVNLAMLWSQCRAYLSKPIGLSGLPLFGTPLCYLVSFFWEALDSLRSRAVMAVVLAYMGALLTVCTLEAARRCHRRSVVIARPTWWWLLFNLAGGALVWQLVVVPAFLHRARRWYVADKGPAVGGGGDGGGDEPAREEARHDDRDRRIEDADVVAIPVAVALGYYLPSICMLAHTEPDFVGAWLPFPVYVTLIRFALRWAIRELRRSEPALVHLESSRWRLVALHAVPVVCSALAHAFVAYAATQRDDRKEMTRSTVTFIEVDLQFIALTVLYWVFVEVGWRAPLAMVAASVVLGPGSGLCLGWIYRERLVLEALGRLVAPGPDADEGTVGDGESDEQTPLLR
ncbi:Uncharacterized protein TCAP_03413 [Tolypocladium capitatum]|uniref:Corticosteroid-binding protein n=1 Tax=Tolypocladium capitatum TaxID=45235 RepID=A0A2K3QGL0_9HYPO|nr:Uncharacterized protein TCAP_03413 [Tolypocladium capitatum]